MAINYDPQITIWMLTSLHCAQQLKIIVNNVMLPTVSPHIRSISPLQVTIHVVPNRYAGEQKPHWDKTKEITI